MDAVLIGGGASVKPNIPEVWNILSSAKDVDVFSINFAYKLLPFKPKIQIWVDKTVWEQCGEDFKKLHDEYGTILYGKHYKPILGCNRLDKPKSIYPAGLVNEFSAERGTKGISIPINGLYGGGSGLSGVCAISLATKLEYDRIFLLGYDAGAVNKNDTNTHWYQDVAENYNICSNGIGKQSAYRNLQANGVLKNLDDYEYFSKYRERIFNVGLTSNITYFNKIDYNKFYEMLKKD